MIMLSLRRWRSGCVSNVNRVASQKQISHSGGVSESDLDPGGVSESDPDTGGVSEAKIQELSDRRLSVGQ